VKRFTDNQQIKDALKAQVMNMEEQKLYQCDCCGQYTIPIKNLYRMCPVCGWIDDRIFRKYPDEHFGGPNIMSLNEAREAYKRGEEVT